MTYRKFRSNPAVIGAVCALGGFLARLPIASTLGATVPYITFYPAVVIGASLGGLAAGLLTAGLSILLAALLILPRGPQPVLSIRNGIAIAVFLAFSAFISWLNEALRRERKATSASEERMRLILANALDAVITIDEAGIITEWNQRAESTFGWSRTDALGRRLRDTVIPPQYREAHEQGVKRYLATRQSSMLDRRIEITGLHRDGREFPVELAITPIQQGDKIGFSAFVRDITSRKQAEARVQTQLARLELLSRTTRAIGERQDLQSILQVVVQNLEDHLALDFVCVSLCDADKKSLSVAAIGAKSQTAGSTLGVAPQATIDVGENGLSSCVRGRLVYEPDSAEVPHPLPARLARAGLRSLVFAPLLVEDDILGVLITARRQPHAFSSVDCEFLRQLSEHVALAARQAELHHALQEAYEELRRSQEFGMQQERLRMLGQMASGVAHDINNAISPLALYTDYVLEHEPSLSGRSRNYLEIGKQAIQDVTDTVARLSDFYRERDQHQPLAAVDLNRLAQEALELTRPRWSDIPQQRGIVIEARAELAQELPPIAGIESEVRSALTNLIFNAVDAMPRGGALTLRTSARPESADSGESKQRVCLDVIDSGIGMDEETRRRCIEPFFTTKGERGTGLGLATVYGVMERHSGTLEIQSVVGQGTRVRLSFAASNPDAPAPVLVDERPPRLRILLADDDPLVLTSLRDILTLDGHDIVAVGGGEEAINTFQRALEHNQSFDSVITDLGMPYVDGRKVAAAVKAMAPSVQVILLTGWGQRLRAEGDKPPHVDHLLSKPTKLRNLRLALAQRQRAS